MADLESRLLPFPHRPRSSASHSVPATVSTRPPVLAEAELRADMVRNLLQQIGGPDGFYPPGPAAKDDRIRRRGAARRDGRAVSASSYRAGNWLSGSRAIRSGRPVSNPMLGSLVGTPRHACTPWARLPLR
jgi:hypothetical protein